MIVPIPVLETGDYDWRVVQEVVYDIKAVNDDFIQQGKFPVDYAFEARFVYYKLSETEKINKIFSHLQNDGWL